MHIMSFIAIPKGVLNGFLAKWQPKEKYRLAKWSTLCQPKEQGA
jgi:hypothetical protein